MNRKSIQGKLMRVMLLTSTVVLVITFSAYFTYEIISFRQESIQNLTTLGKIIAANSTAALAFDSQHDATEILLALKAEPHIIASSIYASDSALFASYPEDVAHHLIPEKPGEAGFRFESSGIVGFLPITQGQQQLGTLYILSNLDAIYNVITLYIIIGIILVVLALMMAYFLSRKLYSGITRPIFKLTVTARAISEQQDYSVRVPKFNDDELGVLTDSFNHMLKEIESFNNELEKKVQERTKELEIANKELESFSYSISHDLRAPLRTVSGFMQIFSEDYVDKLDDEAKRMMDKILTSAKKMGLLIDDILEFSRLGRKELNRSSISMQNLFQEVWDEQIRAENGRAIELISTPLPDAYGDRATLRQVWVNLISNAIKYSRKKEKSIIEVGSSEGDSGVIYYIKDNGAGFNMEYYEKLFGVFQRLHADREFEGTGAGLAIVHRIIKKHGGKIWADAETGKGATFYFVIGKEES